MDNRIIQYYRLNALRDVKNRPLPLVDAIERRAVDVVFTKHHVKLMFNELNGVYYVNETVVGGAKKAKNTLPDSPVVVL